jgi:hypothetical protein
MSKLLDSDYMQDANDAKASGHSTVHRDKNNPNDPRNIEWNLGGKWIQRQTPSILHYDMARNGCGNPIHYKGKVVYCKVRGTTTPTSISLEEMEKQRSESDENKFDEGWMELEHFYVVDEGAMETQPFLSLCQIGLN